MNSLSFNLEDASQIMIGAFALAVPISFSEEAWRLGETLPVLNLMLLVTISIVFLSVYSYYSVFQGDIKHRKFTYVSRIVIAYSLTLVVVALVLLAINKLPLITETSVAIKRLIVIMMPASMGAIFVDSFDKE